MSREEEGKLVPEKDIPPCVLREPNRISHCERLTGMGEGSGREDGRRAHIRRGRVEGGGVGGGGEWGEEEKGRATPRSRHTRRTKRRMGMQRSADGPPSQGAGHSQTPIG